MLTISFSVMDGRWSLSGSIAKKEPRYAISFSVIDDRWSLGIRPIKESPHANYPVLRPGRRHATAVDMRKPVRLLGTILVTPVALLACLPLFVWELCRYRPYNIPWAPRGWWLLLRWAVRWVWPVLLGIWVLANLLLAWRGHITYVHVIEDSYWQAIMVAILFLWRRHF
jgi:hypothetical protein